MPCLKAIKVVLPPISKYPYSYQISKIHTKLAEITPIWQSSHKTGKTPTELAKLQPNCQKSPWLCESHIQLAKQEPYF